MMIVVSRRGVLICVYAALLLLFAGVLLVSLDAARRMVYGAKAGVILHGVSVEGLYREEVARVVADLAESQSRSPRDAMYFPETGEVIEGEPGVMVDVESTVQKVMAAPPGAVLELSVAAVQPRVTARMFEPVYRVNTQEKLASLAVNVAWGEEHIDAMLAAFDRAHVKATFFFTGMWAVKFPELVRKIASHGHEIANHGYSHPHVMGMPEQELKDLIKRNEAVLEELTGRRTGLFAPPYGEVDKNIARTAAQMGYWTIMWTVDTVDWKRPPADAIVQRVLGKTVPGSIVLMHPTAPTVEALPRILSGLREMGYRLVTVSELLKHEQPRAR